MFSKNIIKAFALHTANDATKGSMNCINVSVSRDHFIIESTDGHILMRKQYDLKEWGFLRRILITEYNIDIPSEPTSGLLSIDKKMLQLSGFSTCFNITKENVPVYPDLDRRIPKEFKRDYKQYPVFSFVDMTKMRKTFKLLGIEKVGWFPENWNDTLGATTSIIDDYLFLVMPLELPSRHICNDCNCQIVNNVCNCSKR